MKIGFDVSATCNEKTGCTWYADSLIRAMTENHPEHEYLLYHHFASLCSPIASQGTRIDKDYVSHPYEKFSVAEAKEEWENIAKGKSPAGSPDIIQANFFDCPNIRSTPIVYVIYDLTFFVCPEFLTLRHYFGCTPGLCDALTHASGILFISEYTRQEFNRMFPRWLEETQIPNRVVLLASRGDSKELAPRLGESHWLTVGTLEPRKNHINLLAAHEIYWGLSQHKRPLVIVGGKGWLTEEIHEKIKKCEHEGRILYHGYVADDDLNRLYSESYGFIYPSHYEGFGLPVLEALHRGVPVLSTSTTSLPEVGGDAVGYFDPSSPSDIAEQMLALEANLSIRSERVVKGKEQAAQFSWSKVARETLDFYHEVRESWNRKQAQKWRTEAEAAESTK